MTAVCTAGTGWRIREERRARQYYIRTIEPDRILTSLPEPLVELRVELLPGGGAPCSPSLGAG